ncbi:probable methylenetetrahydrofolate reductase [Coccinella septempunctata]|uniref:probable methylenetetrahydrofolate reductase n=1 Tax=Coccinella septempunctata TaxID=41139 RepID=UPI001D084A5E|nr:probable methylenetetrahydrofolate reductase [Coccinella septempunctata]
MSKSDQRLTNIFKNQTKRICSLEFSSKKDINYDLVDTIPFSFCSVIWIGTYDKPPEEIEPIVAAAELIKRGHPTVLHLAARNVNKKTVPKILEYARQVGVRNLLVMRGAAPGCQEPDSTYDFPYSTDLIKFIKIKYGDYFDLCVPGYPYKHPESKTLEEDMKYLKQKNDAGAKFIISQAAFSYEIYKNFLKNCRKFEISMQIIPGVYMIRSVVDFCLLKKLCKVPTNDPVVQFIKDHKGSEDEIAAYGIKISNEVIRKILQDKDFCPPHIYTMNEFASIRDFISNLKLEK